MMDSRSQTYDIAIAGAGLIGSTLALALAGMGLRILLIDARPAESPAPPPLPGFDARVSAITHASQRLFQRLGVWPAMQQRSCAYTHMHVREADGTGQIDFDARQVYTESLGHIIENAVMVQALDHRLADCPDVDRSYSKSVSAYRLEPDGLASLVFDDGQVVTARLVVAADGAASPLRTMAGIRVREWDYEHRAIVCTVRTENAHQQTARQIFMDTGVLAFLPLPHESEQYCSIVWSLQPDRAAAMLALDDQQFCQQLAFASEHWLGEVLTASARFNFPLLQRHAVEYYRGPLVLVGDAAHSIHPLAGQGANLGLQDVEELAEQLIRAQRSSRPLSDPVVLARYQRRRQPDNLAMMAVMEGFKRLYADQPLPMRWLRNSAMRGIDRMPLLKQQIIRRALG